MPLENTASRLLLHQDIVSGTTIVNFGALWGILSMCIIAWKPYQKKPLVEFGPYL
jgi:hypothetical protein